MMRALAPEARFYFTPHAQSLGKRQQKAEFQRLKQYAESRELKEKRTSGAKAGEWFQSDTVQQSRFFLHRVKPCPSFDSLPQSPGQ
jgi:hypothetical protein